MEIDNNFVTVNGDTVYIRVVDRYDLGCTIALKPVVEEAFQKGAVKVDVDFTMTEYIDSAAVRDLTNLFRRVKSENFHAHDAHGKVFKMLAAAKLDIFWKLTPAVR